jgi:hypothetical protein
MPVYYVPVPPRMEFPICTAAFQENTIKLGQKSQNIRRHSQNIENITLRRHSENIENITLRRHSEYIENKKIELSEDFPKI